uniref:Uncharacterized protein n=1 Tax=Micrurus corallinus TaxID=54390 RepID=A0A2D4G793_MICCO
MSRFRIELLAVGRVSLQYRYDAQLTTTVPTPLPFPRPSGPPAGLASPTFLPGSPSASLSSSACHLPCQPRWTSAARILGPGCPAAASDSVAWPGGTAGRDGRVVGWG